MKLKYFIIIFFILFIYTLSVSSKNTLNLEDNIGDYIYYHDNRIVEYKGELQRRNGLFGIMFLEKDNYLCRYYNLENNDETIISCKIEFKDNNYNLKEFNIIKPGKDENMAMTISVDILNFYNHKQVNFSKFPEDIELTTKYSDDYSLVNIYKFWIPIFHLYETKILSSGEYRWELISFGRMKSKEDNAFFIFNEIPKGINGPELKLLSDKKSKVTLNEIEFLLDDNWIKKENTDFFPKPNVSYWINKVSNRDSILFIEEINFTKYGISSPYDFIKLLFLSSPIYLNPNSIKIKTSNNLIIIEYNSLDLKELLYTKSILYYIPISKNNFKIINFNAFLSIYDINKEYFEEIIKNTKFKNKNIFK